MLKLIFNYVYLFYIAISSSLFMQIFAIIIFYIASKIAYAPRKNWYYPEENMPNYDLNQEEVETIITGLHTLSMNAGSTKEHSNIISLKTKLLQKLGLEKSTPDDIDVWAAFQERK